LPGGPRTWGSACGRVPGRQGTRRPTAAAASNQSVDAPPSRHQPTPGFAPVVPVRGLGGGSRESLIPGSGPGFARTRSSHEVLDSSRRCLAALPPGKDQRAENYPAEARRQDRLDQASRSFLGGILALLSVRCVRSERLRALPCEEPGHRRPAQPGTWLDEMHLR
jgi:hypothetical protein